MKIDNMRLEHQEKLIKDAENEAARQRQQEAEEEKLAAKEAAAEKPAKEVGFIAISVGEGLTDIFEGLGVDYLIEGGQTMNPSTEDILNAVDMVNAKTILIQPWDKNMLRPLEKAIIDSNIGLTPSNNGEQIRLTIPPLTEERRKELVKQIRGEAETARISLRNARRDAVEAFKKAQKEGMPEDESKDGETQSQKLLEKFSKTLDEALSKKEKEIMTV